MTIGQGAHEKLLRARALLGHQVPSGDLPEVFERALDALIDKLEKSKFAATNRPRKDVPAAKPQSRRIPAHVKRAVVERDGRRCAFVGPTGDRCEETRRLEFDHVVPVACGGRSTVDNVRLLCRAHNQHAAERTFGREHIDSKRRVAKVKREAEARIAKARADDLARAAERTRAAAEARARSIAEMLPYLQKLGLTASEARRAAECPEIRNEMPLEERVRLALAFHGRMAAIARVVRFESAPEERAKDTTAA